MIMVATRVGSRYYEKVNENDMEGVPQDFVVKYNTILDDEGENPTQGSRNCRWLETAFLASPGARDENTNDNYEAIKTALGI